MNVFIRQAMPSDARAIVAVAAEVWPDEPLDAATIAHLIAESPRVTLVAEVNDDVVGFVDGFATLAANGARRWEVDLLAVSGATQGQGIGRRLVGESIAAGAAAGASRPRALIRVGNAASERAFAVCGFARDEGERELWVAQGLVPEEIGSLMHVVPVQTFRYVGLWLEEVTADALRAVRSVEDERGVIGAVIDLADREVIDAAAVIGMQAAGRYCFWRRGSLTNSVGHSS